MIIFIVGEPTCALLCNATALIFSNNNLSKIYMAMLYRAAHIYLLIYLGELKC